MIIDRFPEAPAPEVSVRVATFPADGETAEELVAFLQDEVDGTRSSAA
jgi:hypothetical protein